MKVKNNNIKILSITFLFMFSVIFINNNYATNNNTNVIEPNPLLEINTSNEPVIPIIYNNDNNLNIATQNEIFEHDGIKYKKGELVGNFKITGYCSCPKCTGNPNGSFKSYSGKTVRANHTIAADLKVLPLNTMIIFEGTKGKNVENYNGVYQVEDKGGGVKNQHIDIYQPTHDLASLVTYYGKSYGNVYLAIPISQ